MVAGYQPSASGITITQLVMASLPPAASSTGMIFYAPDAPGGASLVVSDGSTWRPFARGVQRMAQVTDSSGIATFTFSPAYSAAPIPTIAIGDAATGELTYKVTAISASAMTVAVKRSRTLPTALTLLTQLLGFDIFANAASGVTVYITAAPATS